MTLQTTAVHVVSDGTFLIDGGAIFGEVPRPTWELNMKPDRKNRVRLGLNCLLIQTPQKTILVDTGAGSKRVDKFRELYSLSGNKLLRDLRKLGLTARDIDIVILSHLHYDHSGGCTKLNRYGESVPAFPKAEYLVQRECWEEAKEPDERGKNKYYEDDFYPLEEAGVLTLLDGDTEVLPGVNLKKTGGHSAGHQIVFVEAGSERIAFVADLIPTPFHVPLNCISSFDQLPSDTLAKKDEIMQTAIEGGWLLIFGHAPLQRAGYLEQRGGKHQLLPVDL